MIYAGTRRAVETIRSDLARLGISTAAYHAGLEPEARSCVQEGFLGGKTHTVVATNAFGMGVDKSDVRLVVHYQMPATLESYYQEAGRAGRDGAAARCVALWGREDQRLHTTFLDRSRPPVRRLKRVARILRRTIGAGERGFVEADRLARAVGCTEEELATLLPVLERLGVVRLDGRSGWVGPDADPGCTESPATSDALHDLPTLDLGVRASDPDWSRARLLRKAGLESLRAVRDYATKSQCRRQALLGYFGDETRSCGG